MNDEQSLNGVAHNFAFRTWEQLSERDQLLSMISDSYKSINGVRPRWDTSHMTIEEVRAWNDDLTNEIRATIEQEAADELAHKKAVKAAMTVHTGFSIGDLVGLKLA